MRGGKGWALGKNDCHHWRSSETSTQPADCSPEEESHQARLRPHAQATQRHRQTRHAIPPKETSCAISRATNEKGAHWPIHATAIRCASNAIVFIILRCNPYKRNYPSNRYKCSQPQGNQISKQWTCEKPAIRPTAISHASNANMSCVAIQSLKVKRVGQSMPLQTLVQSGCCNQLCRQCKCL